MPITIDSFKRIAGAANAQAGIKVDRWNSKGDDVALKTFGGGKTPRGVARRLSDGFLSKVYSFFKDPSGKANQKMRQEFVRAFDRSYPNHGLDLKKLVDTESTQPLRARLVKQLIDQAETKPVSGEKSFGMKENVEHSAIKDGFEIVKKAELFIQRGRIEGGSIQLLKAVNDPMSFMKERRIGFENKMPRLQQEAISNLFTKGEKFEGCESFGILAGLRFPTKLRNIKGEMEIFSLKNVMNFVPGNIAEKNDEVDIGFGLQNPNLFNELDHLATGMLAEFKDGKGYENNFAVARDRADQILERTGDMKKEVMGMIDFMLKPETREAFEKYADSMDAKLKFSGNDKQRMADVLDLYDGIVSNLRFFAKQMDDPNGAFQGLVALCMMVSGKPEEANDMLAH